MDKKIRKKIKDKLNELLLKLTPEEIESKVLSEENAEFLMKKIDEIYDIANQRLDYFSDSLNDDSLTEDEIKITLIIDKYLNEFQQQLTSELMKIHLGQKEFFINLIDPKYEMYEDSMRGTYTESVKRIGEKLGIDISQYKNKGKYAVQGGYQIPLIEGILIGSYYKSIDTSYNRDIKKCLKNLAEYKVDISESITEIFKEFFLKVVDKYLSLEGEEEGNTDVEKNKYSNLKRLMIEKIYQNLIDSNKTKLKFNSEISNFKEHIEILFNQKINELYEVIIGQYIPFLDMKNLRSDINTQDEELKATKEMSTIESTLIKLNNENPRTPENLLPQIETSIDVVFEILQSASRYYLSFPYIDDNEDSEKTAHFKKFTKSNQIYNNKDLWTCCLIRAFSDKNILCRLNLDNTLNCNIKLKQS